MTQNTKSIEEAVLRLFFQEPDQAVSGESLAQSLGLSRTAIWNHIESLRQLGYSIEARPHVGYFLTQTPDRYVPDEIRARLNTKILGQTLFSYEEVDSTNDLASRLAEEGACEGTFLVAESQRRGRGRLGREWVSPKQKGLWSSLILRPKRHPSKAAGLTLMAALAVARAIQITSGLQVKIKWPNDVLLHGKKVCGILSEMRSEPDQIRFVVLGVGVNLNFSQSEFPAAIQTVATSVSAQAHKTISRVQFLCHYLEELEKLYFSKNEEELIHEVKALCVTLGKEVRIQRGNQLLCGEALDLDETGALILQKPDGAIEKVHSGDLDDVTRN